MNIWSKFQPSNFSRLAVRSFQSPSLQWVVFLWDTLYIFNFCNFSNTLFDQKSPAHLFPVANGGDGQMTYNTSADIVTYRLNQPRDRFSKNLPNTVHLDPKVGILCSLISNHHSNIVHDFLYRPHITAQISA